MKIGRLMRFHTGSRVMGLVKLCWDVNKHFEKQPITVVEMGVFAGESTVIFASQLRFEKIHSIDLWASNDGYPSEQIQWAERRYDMLFKGNKAVLKHKCSSTDDKFKDFKVDFVYIDADHSYEGVKKDIEFWRGKTKVIAGHDYGMGHTPGVVKAVNEAFGKPDKIYEDFSWIKYL
jgi:hypothetical protein